MDMQDTWEEPAEIRTIEYSRHRTVLDMLTANEIKTSRKILEIGCNVGFSTYVFWREGLLKNKIYLGIDSDDKAIRKAISKAQEFSWQEIHFKTLSLEDAKKVYLGEMDIVIAEEILEHTCIKSSLTEIWTILKPGGVLVFSVPYKEKKSIGKKWGHLVFDLNEEKIGQLLNRTNFLSKKFYVKTLVWPRPDLPEKVMFVKTRKINRKKA